MFQLVGDLIEAAVGFLLKILVPSALIALAGVLLMGDEIGALFGAAFGLAVVGWRFGLVPLWRLITSREVPATFVEIVGRATFGAARRGWAMAAFEADGERIELKIPVRHARRFARAMVPGVRGDLRFSGRLLQSWHAATEQ
jgi:hypothetical protein